MTGAALSAAEIRRDLGHPVIDADGHLVECPPVLIDFVRQAGGARMAQRYVETMSNGAWGKWQDLSPAERRERGIIRRPFWAMPANTHDRATALLPNLLRERLDEFGIDFQVLFPTVAIPFISGAIDAEMRQTMCRALNLMYAEVFRGHASRIAPAAVIPMHTPAEALAEIDFAIGTLGFKTAMIAGTVQRPLPAVAKVAPELGPYAFWIDPLALDSEYDYDPVWRRFNELRVAPCTHNNSMGWGLRRSASSFVYNHIGHFAAAAEAFCKALFLGGVSRRFPNLRFGFLEGGAGWAANFYNDLCEHFEKRSLPALRAHLDPATVDRRALRGYFERYGDDRYRSVAAAVEQGWDHALIAPEGDEAEPTDEFAATGIAKGRDIMRVFRKNYFFGCEADDRMTAVGFDARLNHYDLKLNAMLGSDVGHFDVTDMAAVLGEAYELVEHGLLAPDDFRAFTFTNVAALHAGMNPAFFAGTVVEDAVRAAIFGAKAAAE
ncbi:MAG: amidohydrolase [Alphaproteobacteria bacterium]|nr:amidohydrolase [Alphaproteobacteria bacterium]